MKTIQPLPIQQYLMRSEDEDMAMESKVFQEFKQRQAEVNALYEEKSRSLSRDYSLLRDSEQRRGVLEDLIALIVPKGSYIDTFLSLFKVPSTTSQKRSAAASRYMERIADFLPHRWRPWVNSWIKYQPLIQIAYNVAKPVLISAGISAARNLFRGVLSRFLPIFRKR